MALNTTSGSSERRSRLGIRARAIILVGLVLTVAMAGVTVLSILDKRRTLTKELEQRLVALANHQSAAIADAMWDLNRSRVNAVLSGLSQDPDFVSAETRDDTGRIFAEFSVKSVPPNMALSRSEKVAIQYDGQEKVIGRLTITLSRERLIAAQHRAAVEALILGAILFAAMMIAVVLVLQMVLKPLAEISSRMLGVAAGDLESPIPYGKRPDPIGEVARAVDQFCTTIQERARVQQALKAAHDEMEQRVEERTEELRRTEALFRSVVTASPAEIFVRNKDGHMLMVNAAWEAAHGVSEKDIVGKTEWGLFPLELADRFIEQDRFVIDTGKPLNIEVELKVGDKTKFQHTIKFPLCDADGNVSGLGGIISDITERKQAEEQLRQAQKMEAVGQLTGGVAHDFNNLLAVIMGNAELLQEQLQQEHMELSEILRASQRGAALTQRLLSFSRQQSLRPKAIDLAELVSNLSQMLARTLGETIEIEIGFGPDLWPTLADPTQLEVALLNLALNARDAMTAGGRLTLECANVELDDAYVAGHPETRAGEYVVLAVGDEGAGMTAEVQARAFEPFFTTKEVGQGSGLGLSMVYGFAKQSGGHVTISSEPGQGTTVRLYLPRADQAAPVEAPNRESNMPRGRGELILVVEDDPEMRALASQLLKSLGYRVIAVHNAASAREVLAADERVDLVLSDVVLPGGLSGPQFIEEARAADPSLKVIFMSGYPAEAAMHGTLPDFDHMLLNKPFQRRQLATAVDEAFGRRVAEVEGLAGET